jgi:hypothetical protein
MVLLTGSEYEVATLPDDFSDFEDLVPIFGLARAASAASISFSFCLQQRVTITKQQRHQQE